MEMAHPPEINFVGCADHNEAGVPAALLGGNRIGGVATRARECHHAWRLPESSRRHAAVPPDDDRIVL